MRRLPFRQHSIAQGIFISLALIFAEAGSRHGHAGPAELESATPAGGLPLKEVRPGIYQVGELRIDRAANEVSFPGKVNMRHGLIEYAIVGPKGSTHESLLVTEVPPSDVHMGMLLLGAKGSGLHAPAPGEQPPGPITPEYLKRAPELKGDRIAVTLSWKHEAEEKTARLEDWIFNTQAKKAAAQGPWIYNGSMFAGDKFLAQVEGNLAALVTTPAALINNPRKDSNNDAAWEVNENVVPVVGTPVKITIRLEPDTLPQE